MKNTLRSLFLLLAVLATAPVALAGGTSHTPNQVAGYMLRFMVNFIKTPGVAVSAAENATLTKFTDSVADFYAWQQFAESAAPFLDFRRVQAGPTYTVNETNATWFGTFASFPVGNQNGVIFPVLECATPPCALPAFLSGYSGFVSHLPINDKHIADTAWTTIGAAGGNRYGSTAQLSTAHAVPCHVEENELGTQADQSRHASGRLVSINHAIVSTLSTDATKSWFTRCILLALNSGLYYGPASDVTLLHPTEPDIIPGGLPSAIDDAMLAVAWDSLSQTTTGVYPLPDPELAVP